MFTIALIGVGQIGSRHLQGLAQSALKLKIFAVDPNEQSLLTAKGRWNEVVHPNKKNHLLSFAPSIETIPKDLDLAIIACNSFPRLEIVENFLKKKNVRFLVLEKVLFPRLEDYGFISNLLEKTGVKAWVNCPRRMFSVYKKIKEKISSNTKIQFSVTGSQWGLGCNGLHMLDLFCYFTGTYEITIQTQGLDNQIIESKRDGYKEFTGNIHGYDSNGNTFLVSSFSSGSSPIVVSITIPNYHFQVVEGKKKVTIFSSETNWCPITKSIELPFQSQLSHLFVDQILKSGNCALPNYEESSSIHQSFIKALLGFIKIQTGKKEAVCPIT